MPSYLRQSASGRTILVRPSFYERNGWKESAPYDCLDLTDAIDPCADYQGAITNELTANPNRYRTEEYREHSRGSHPLFGCCVPATESLFFLLPQDTFPKPYRALDEDNIYHWWCQTICPTSGDSLIHDATASQFDAMPFSAPYSAGKKTPLMGWKNAPQKRTLDLIERVVPGAARYRCDHDDYLPPATLEEFFDV